MGGNTGTLVLTGTNTYTGTTFVGGSGNTQKFRADDGVGLPTNSPLSIDNAVWETSGTVQRSLGAPVAGIGTIQIQG